MQWSGRLVDIPVLSEDECAHVVARIDELRSRWVMRGSKRLNTLGRATYLDVPRGEAAPGANMIKLVSDNYMLMENFGPIYSRVTDVLSGVLRADANLTKDFALPGFHIFEGEGLLGAPQAPPHFDMQYRLLNWAADADEAEPISFTLALEIPAAGAGLTVWSDTPARVEERFRAGELRSMNEYTEVIGPGRFHPYALGQITVHMDRILHRVGGISDVHPSDRRITLQGHGRKLDGAWRLYW